MGGSQRTRFALALALLWLVVAASVGATSYVIWSSLGETERDLLGDALAAHAPLVVLAAVVLALVLAALLHRAFEAYPAAASRLTQEVRDIYTVNAQRRIEPAGGAELRSLASAINSFALVHDTLRRSVDARVAESNARLAQQKNRLAALMAQLAQSVIVCNAEGRILLYNERATGLLGGDVPVGLGRSIFGVLDRSLVVHALERIRHGLAHDGASAAAQFVTARGDALLRCRMAPVLDDAGQPGGYVLVLADITRTVEAESRRDFLLQQLTERTRASLGSIRAAVETMQQYPQMDDARRARFVEVIREEAHKLSVGLDETLARHPDTLRAQWAFEDMLASDLVVALQRNIEAALGVAVTRVHAEPGMWLAVDSYALVQALTHVVAQLVDRFGVRELAIDAAAAGRLVRLTLAWPGSGPDATLLHEWEQQPFAFGAAGTPPTLRAVLERHGGELWCRAEPQGQRLCVELPVTEPERVAPPETALPSRPVYYDFDLFSQPGQTPELDERPLAELAYTVFDTETTGLDPSAGDEIISIGAVRIVNGRLLENECFDQLVNPRRPVRRESQEVHGLTDAVLADQPAIDEVLPRFQRFVEDTVLVAHNAAFDMRFLQLKEGATGVRFIQPVLDTLLLSVLTHPGRSDAEHRLEAIAARLGVPVVGRHTALGDAMVTGEVFLRLVPLLAERGIHTLRQAREASQRTLYAKLEY
jgi:DNA polymerase-3 subunit epsilon